MKWISRASLRAQLLPSLMLLSILPTMLVGCASEPQPPTMATSRVRELQRALRRKQDEIALLKERNQALTRKVQAMNVQQASAAASPLLQAQQKAPMQQVAPRAALPTRLPAYAAKGSGTGLQHQASIEERIEKEIASRSNAATVAPAVAPAPVANTVAEQTPELKAAPEEKGDVSGEQALYGKVLEAYRMHRLEEMQKAVSFLLKTYPDSAFADNALYVTGLLAFENGDADRATFYMDRVLREYPSGNKAVAALFAKAMVQKRLGRQQEARVILNQVRKLYPGSPEASRASLEAKLLEGQMPGRGEN